MRSGNVLAIRIKQRVQARMIALEYERDQRRLAFERAARRRRNAKRAACALACLALLSLALLVSR